MYIIYCCFISSHPGAAKVYYKLNVYFDIAEGSFQNTYLKQVNVC